MEENISGVHIKALFFNTSYLQSLKEQKYSVWE